MTIRYKCTGCASVLKIKDEKAGTNGKCPKCKLEFLVPGPDADDDGIEVESEANLPKDDELEDSVDMPIELTPDVSESEEFDPLEVLGGKDTKATNSPSRPTSTGFSPGDRKPSVAELMKDFEASKKKNRDERPSSESSRPSPASAVETAGSAASALTKAYEKKRDSVSAPSMSVKEVKAAEQQELFKEFIKGKAAPGAAIIFVLLYGLYWLTNREIYEGPPLYQASGQVKLSGQPGSGVQLYFEPLPSPGTIDVRQNLTAFCDQEGKFRLYTDIFSGAPAGQYRIDIRDQNGVPVPMASELVVTVAEDDKNEFKINN